MTHTTILTETRERVGIVTLNRPQVMNAFNITMLTELFDALEEFDTSESIGAILVAGNEKAFAAGADIKEMAGKTAVDMFAGADVTDWSRLTRIAKPIVAAVSGFALGGGCEIAMTCDMIVASETAVFGQPEINLGIIPGAGGTQRLTRAVGKALAMEIILTDRRLSAEEALRFGLVNRVSPVELYLKEAIELAQKVGERSQVAVRMAKDAVNKAYELSLAEGLVFEKRNFYLLFSTEDRAEGMNAFVEKRKANWKNK